MSEPYIEVTRRHLLGSLLTVGGASAAAGAGTVSYFSDSTSSTNNNVQAGTIEINSNDTGTFQFSTSLAPGDPTMGTVTLVSDGTLDGSLDVDVDYEKNDAETAPEPDMAADAVAENLEITGLVYGNNPDLVDQIDSPSSSPPTLHELATNAQSEGEDMPNDLVDLDDPGNGTDFTVELRLKDVGDDFQGDGIDVKFTFHLNQTNGQ